MISSCTDLLDVSVSAVPGAETDLHLLPGLPRVGHHHYSKSPACALTQAICIYRLLTAYVYYMVLFFSLALNDASARSVLM